MAAFIHAAPRLAPYGLQNFSEHYQQAVETYFSAEKMVKSGRHAQALALLNALWEKYPMGSQSWSNLNQQAGGIFTGHPPAYASLQMLTKVAVVFSAKSKGARETLKMTVLVVDKSSGFDPANLDQLVANQGNPVEHTIDARLTKTNFGVVRDSLWLFSEYLGALTNGDAKFTVNVLRAKTSLPIVHIRNPDGGITARPEGAGYSQIWNAVDTRVRQQTDFWVMIFPSHKPSSNELRTQYYITGGGMGSAPDGSPLILIDDQFLLKAQPHFKVGEKDFDAIERQLYLPQFYQHEFFHFVYAHYPEFGLEAQGHQWHKRSSWPQDFSGTFESDYYRESFEKRINTATVPLIGKLRYQAPPDSLWRTLDEADIAGVYERAPVQNNWHKGTIAADAQGLVWKNAANAQWRLAWQKNGLLGTGEDNPYYKSNPATGRAFQLKLKKGENGRYTNQIEGFYFNGEFYLRAS